MITAETIFAARTEKGGWTKAQLAKWGVPWPPRKGWIQKLIDREEIEPDEMPEDMRLEVAITILERRAANNEHLGRANRTSPDGNSVAEWHLMQAAAIRTVLPHAKAALSVMRGAV